MRLCLWAVSYTHLGGALVFQNNEYQEKAEILREKGTDRSKFFRGQVDKYRWIDYGSSYLPSEMNAAYLYAQLEEAEKIDGKRHQIYDYYNEGLKSLEEQEKIQRPVVPEGCKHNAHMYYICLLYTSKEMEELLHHGPWENPLEGLPETPVQKLGFSGGEISWKAPEIPGWRISSAHIPCNHFYICLLYTSVMD